MELLTTFHWALFVAKAALTPPPRLSIMLQPTSSSFMKHLPAKREDVSPSGLFPLERSYQELLIRLQSNPHLLPDGLPSEEANILLLPVTAGFASVFSMLECREGHLLVQKQELLATLSSEQSWGCAPRQADGYSHPSSYSSHPFSEKLRDLNFKHKCVCLYTLSWE